MARSLDELIDYLLGEIALSGQQGKLTNFRTDGAVEFAEPLP